MAPHALGLLAGAEGGALPKALWLPIRVAGTSDITNRKVPCYIFNHFEHDISEDHSYVNLLGSSCNWSNAARFRS